MATATVSGANDQTVTLTFDTNANAVLAQQLAAAITEGVEAGQIIPADSKNGPPPPLPPGKTGEFIQSTPGSTVLPTGYGAVISTASDPIITGSGDKGQTVLSSSTSDLHYFDVGGTGTVVAGGGGNRLVFSTPSSPPQPPQPPPPGTPPPGWAINAGNGDDTVVSTNGKSDTINAGVGHNALQLGNGDLVLSTGDDTVVASGGGSDTILATGSHSALVFGVAADIYFVSDGGSATVAGGTGSDTFFGGKGPDLVYGGTGGNNYLFAGTGSATLFGGGDGDQLFAAGTESQELHAGVGNETLFGGFGSGANTFHAGAGSNEIIGGSGNDTFIAAAGSATITGATGGDMFMFTNGQAGGQDLIQDFTSGADTVDLVGYGKGAVAAALKSQTVASGSATITLSDSTKITFSGVTNLKASDFS